MEGEVMEMAADEEEEEAVEEEEEEEEVVEREEVMEVAHHLDSSYLSKCKVCILKVVVNNNDIFLVCQHQEENNSIRYQLRFFLPLITSGYT